MSPKDSHHPLVVLLDAIIDKHKDSDPDLHKNLCAYRESLIQALKQGRNKDAAKLALQIASWIKFVFDLWAD